MSSNFEFAPVKGKKTPPSKETEKAVVEIIEKEAPPESNKEKTPSAADYDPVELLTIFDEMVFQGEYSEEVNIGKSGRLKVVFKTRTAKQVSDMIVTLDKLDAKMFATLNETRSIIGLRDALVSYNGRDLSSMKAEQKAEFFDQIPGPIVAMLLGALQKFDVKVGFACSEGEANF